jgi:signal peptidase
MCGVLTSSMEPFIRKGSLVITTESEKYNINDVITYKTGQDSETITHRITELKNTENKVLFITKGDANEHNDPEPVEKKNIVGKVVLVIPSLFNILSFISSYKVIPILFYLPIGLLFGILSHKLMFL